jgi:ElaB/YqjD/DUF883 family membrane-anchored ribosome-binding protein
MLWEIANPRFYAFAEESSMNVNKSGMTDANTTANKIDEKIDSLRDGMKGLVDQGAQKVEAIKTKVSEVTDEAIHRSGDMVARMTDLIKAHPLKAVGLAFGAGYLGMRLFRR